MNADLKRLENIENELKDITQNFDSRDVNLVDCLSGLNTAMKIKLRR